MMNASERWNQVRELEALQHGQRRVRQWLVDRASGQDREGLAAANRGQGRQSGHGGETSEGACS